jgi:hypothetical protein
MTQDIDLPASKVRKKEREQKMQVHFPRNHVNQTCLGKDGQFELKRNSMWINPFNPVIMNLFRCDHDIVFKWFEK